MFEAIASYLERASFPVSIHDYVGCCAPMIFVEMAYGSLLTIHWADDNLKSEIYGLLSVEHRSAPVVLPGLSAPDSLDMLVQRLHTLNKVITRWVEKKS